MLWRLWLLVATDRPSNRGTMTPIELLWTAKNINMMRIVWICKVVQSQRSKVIAWLGTILNRRTSRQTNVQNNFIFEHYFIKSARPYLALLKHFIESFLFGGALLSTICDIVLFLAFLALFRSKGYKVLSCNHRKNCEWCPMSLFIQGSQCNCRTCVLKPFFLWQKKAKKLH